MYGPLLTGHHFKNNKNYTMLSTSKFLMAVVFHALIFLIIVPLSLCNDKLSQTNLILIMYDDLRPELKVYGRKHMITPNFDRLAAKSVIFDNANCQVAVCNPSRNSLLTGLRPDAIGSFDFSTTFNTNLVLPVQLGNSSYSTAGYGKIFHWDSNGYWNFDFWGNDWYDYQNKERGWQNSTVMPDKIATESDYRDDIMTTKAIEGLKRLKDAEKYFMLAIGYKLPHMSYHLPYKYYEMYKNVSWELTPKELTFPDEVPVAEFRSEAWFNYMNEEGSKRAQKRLEMLNPNIEVPIEVNNELMRGYSGGISFLDKQLGRLLDTLDELELWNNATVVLTSDHGMHFGEKGIWQKWTLFDESTRIPLFVYHPNSPFAGKRFSAPVELLDVYPTILDLVKPSITRKDVCKTLGPWKCAPLQGKSLAGLVFGSPLHHHNLRGGHTADNSVKHPGSTLHLHKIWNNDTHIFDNRDRYAVTQLLRCIPLESLHLINSTTGSLLNRNRKIKVNPFSDCSDYIIKRSHDLMWNSAVPANVEEADRKRVIAIMGYSMRTEKHRFTSWVRFNTSGARILDEFIDAPLYEELYDQGESLGEAYAHKEIKNLIHCGSDIKDVITHFRKSMNSFIRHSNMLPKSI